MLKKIINKINYIIATRNSDSYIKYLKKNGCSIGKYCTFYAPKNTNIDLKRLKFIEIGDYVQITNNVTILAHDFSYSVLKKYCNELPQKISYTKIGNNVFIGMNSVILLGSKIGNNVIVGAGAVVSGNIPDNCVVAGNPAKVICTIDEYLNKCLLKMESSFYDVCTKYYKINGKYPSKEEIGYYNLWFMDENEKDNNMNLFYYDSIEDEEIKKYIQTKRKRYDSIEEFIEKVQNGKK